MGPEHAWDELEPKLKSLLDEFKEKGVESFHMGEALARKKSFGNLDKPMMNYLVTQFAKLLGASGVQPIFCAVVNEDWNDTINSEGFLQRFPKPFHLCFEHLLHSLFEWSCKHSHGALVTPMFASHPEYLSWMKEAGSEFNGDENLKKVIGPISFDDASQNIPLQCADLIAHQMYWEIRKRAFETVSINSGGQTNALYWATGGKYIYGNWLDSDGLKIVMTKYAEKGSIWPRAFG